MPRDAGGSGEGKHDVGRRGDAILDVEAEADAYVFAGLSQAPPAAWVAPGRAREVAERLFR